MQLWHPTHRSESLTESLITPSPSNRLQKESFEKLSTMSFRPKGEILKYLTS